MVINLLMNAIDACPAQGGQVKIRIARDAGIARLIVSDNGSGIEPNDRARIFEPFFTTKDPGKGTGLGLSVCHRIIRDHGGEIGVQSRPGGGSVFTVSLPLAEPST